MRRLRESLARLHEVPEETEVAAITNLAAEKSKKCFIARMCICARGANNYLLFLGECVTKTIKDLKDFSSFHKEALLKSQVVVYFVGRAKSVPQVEGGAGGAEEVPGEADRGSGRQ